MAHTNRWIIEEILTGQKRSVRTVSAEPHLVYLPTKVQLTLIDDLEALKNENIPYHEISQLHTNQQKFEFQKVRVYLADQNTLDSDLFQRPDTKKDEHKQMIGYLKNTALVHFGFLFLFISVSYLITYFEEKPKQVINAKIELINSQTPPQPQAPVKQIVNKTFKPKLTKKITQVTPYQKNKIINSSIKVAPKKSTQDHEFLNALKSGSGSGGNFKKIVKSIGQGKGSGGSSYGQSMGGLSSMVSQKGLLSTQSGRGSLKSTGNLGYGSGRSGGSQSTGMGVKVVAASGAFSIPGAEDGDLAAYGLDRDQITAVINKHKGEITYCYESSLKSNPSLRGKVSIQFIINPSGRVSKANIAESSAQSPTLESCMIAKLRSWKFPQPIGKVNVDVLYPFHLTQLGQR